MRIAKGDGYGRNRMTLHEATTPGGECVFVAEDEVERGSEGPFHVVYVTEDRRRRWGFQCGACGSFSTAMDSMGRIACNDCANRRKPDEWDAAHT